MAVDIFEWKWDLEFTESFRYCAKAGHVTVKVEEPTDFQEWGVIFEWGDFRRHYEITEEENVLIEVAKYIAIGINAKIEAQMADDE